MSRSRATKDHEPSDSRLPSPRTTIVGGRPPDLGTTLAPVPTGMQRLLRLASVDEHFREQLVERRAGVASAAEVALTASEAAVLAAIDADQLRDMARKLPPPDPARREFLRQSAATAVVLLGGAALGEALSGCRNRGTAAESDDVPTRPEHREAEVAGGAAPHLPPEPPPDAATSAERPEHREMETEGGAAPAEPPPRPEHRETATKGGAAPDEPESR